MSAENIERLLSSSVNHELETSTPFTIAVEGPVCAGKSTVLEGLKANGSEMIQEYSEYVASATRDFPRFPPANPDVAKDSFMFFLELEARRAQDMKLVRTREVGIDRSIYTLLAFEAGASRITGIDILPWASETLLEQRSNLILPDHIVYMDVPTAISRERARLAQIKIPDFLFSDEFNAGFRTFFMELKNKKPNYVTVVDATSTAEEMLETLMTTKESLIK